MNSNNLKCIIRTSTDNLFSFFVDNSCLFVEYLNNTNKGNKSCLKTNVSNFDVTLDANDCIHIVFLSENILKYFILNQSFETDILPNSKFVSIEHISITSIENSIHIFRSEFNTALGTVCVMHSMYFKNTWHHVHLNTLKSSKQIHSFYIYITNNDLYLLLSRDIHFNYLELKKFDSVKKHWLTLTEATMDTTQNNLSFIITPDNIAVLCYTSLINKNLQIFIKFTHLSKKHSLWETLPISNPNTTSANPLIFHVDDYTHIIWQNGNTSIHRKTKNFERFYTSESLFHNFCKYISMSPTSTKIIANKIPMDLIYSKSELINKLRTLTQLNEKLLIKLNNASMNRDEEIIRLREENRLLLIESNLKLNSMFLLLEEKNSIIKTLLD